MGYIGNAPADQAIEIGTGTVGTTEIEDLSILNADVSASAAIAYSKFGSIPTWNQSTTGSAATVTTNANLTGDVTSSGNATTIASLAFNKMANLTTSRALVSDGSGDVSISAVTSTEVGYLDGVSSSIQTQLGTKAALASPTLTGTPLSTTASAATNTTQIATTAFVRTEVTNLIDSAPSALDTLNELAAALGDDVNFSTTVTNSIATKSPTAGNASLVTVGTIGTGVWQGTPITSAYLNASQSAITSVGTLTTLTVDDITLNGSTISDSGDFTLDVGGRIDLSADDNGEIRLYDGSLMYAVISEDSNRLKIKSVIQDADLIIAGNDGGSEISAVLFDMSEGGNATFAGTVQAPTIRATSELKSADNFYVAGGQSYLGAENGSTDNTWRMYGYTGDFILQSRRSGTWATRFSLDGSDNAIFAGAVSLSQSTANSYGLNAYHSSGNTSSSAHIIRGDSGSSTKAILEVHEEATRSNLATNVFLVSSTTSDTELFRVKADGNAEFSGNVKLGDTYSEGRTASFIESNLADDNVVQLGVGGANGITLLRAYDFNGGYRVAIGALFMWMSESPASISDLGHQSTHSGSTLATHEIIYKKADAFATAPSSSNLDGTDGKITIWCSYPNGVYLINRSGATLTSVQTYNFV
jgi:hypothetical protein